MAITIKNKTRLSELADTMRDRIRQELRSELPNIRDDILDRTLSGVDKDGGSFRPYNEDYKRRKDREAIFGGDPVNLALTGDMLDSMSTSVSSSGPVEAKIEITGGFNREKARFNSDRPIMGLDGTMRTKLARIVRNAIARVRRR